MLTQEQEEAIIKKELSYHTSRSGGKGGQNVNKVETKVEISFDVLVSEALSSRQKETVLRKLTELQEGSLIRIVANVHRSQFENKTEAQKKLYAFLNKLLKPVKKRVPTKPSKASKQRVLVEKKLKSEKKSLRQKLR